ncbi:MAG: LysR family transcriptional regulator [Polyangiaceae bacterium]|nr:LysR family transcriptional regulator [Myxococcales bacterium]MCB9589550.1 LysR family transcriptional regulator [Polyangiaceae bacterium]MCB9609178.1 LysR family transcriptional regulator [Polyangiaceae bacterium]
MSAPLSPTPLVEQNWDDLRVFLALARAGSLSGAARELGLHHTTAYRRLLAMERASGVVLFERMPSGYALTQAGETLFAHAKRVEEELYAASRSLVGHDQNPSGTIRVTTVYSLLDVLLPCIASLQVACPALRVDLDVSPLARDLERREADVALRPTDGPPGSVVGRRVAKVAWALFRKARLGRKAIEGLQAIEYSSELTHLSVIDAFKKLKLEPARLAVSSVPAMREAILGGHGFGALPCYYADSHPGLTQHALGADCESALLPTKSELWLLIHGDLRTSARIRAFIDHVAPRLVAQRALFEGAG